MCINFSKYARRAFGYSAAGAFGYSADCADVVFTECALGYAIITGTVIVHFGILYLETQACFLVFYFWKPGVLFGIIVLEAMCAFWYSIFGSPCVLFGIAFLEPAWGFISPPYVYSL